MSLLDLGIDIGGTKIALGLSKKNSLGLAREAIISAEPHMAPGLWYKRLQQAIHELLGKDQSVFLKAGRIGLGIPGQIHANGKIGHCPNTPVLRKFNLIQNLKRDFKVPVFADNDANVAALAEHQFGAGKSSARMVYVTISTGIGGGLIENGKLVTGRDHLAGELGHMVIQMDGELCGCGRRGCLEAYGRGPALQARMQARLSKTKLSSDEKALLKLAGGKVQQWSNQLLAQALKQGNRAAVAELDQHARYLAEGIGSIANILNPERIVLGGGLTQLGKPLFDGIHKYVRARAIAKHVDIRRAKLGSEVGIYGAIALCRQ